MKDKNKLEDISVIDTAQKLGVSTRSVINYIKSKEIHAIKVGKAWYVNRASLDSFILKYKFSAKEITNRSPSCEVRKETSTNKKYSVKDLRLFLKLQELMPYGCLREIEINEEILVTVSRLHLDALKYIGSGYYSFGAENKMQHYEKSREKIAGIIAILYGVSLANTKVSNLLNKIEDELLPVYSSLIKRMDKKIERPKDL